MKIDFLGTFAWGWREEFSRFPLNSRSKLKKYFIKGTFLEQRSSKQSTILSLLDMNKHELCVHVYHITSLCKQLKKPHKTPQKIKIKNK